MMDWAPTVFHVLSLIYIHFQHTVAPRVGLFYPWFLVAALGGGDEGQACRYISVRAVQYHHVI